MTTLRSVLIGLLLLSVSSWASEPALKTGTLHGAAYALAVPTKWNGKLLLYAHGYRPEGFPNPANLKVDRAAYRELVEKGWIVGMTSYRRTGFLFEEAQQDLNALRDLVEKRYGKPSMTLLHGESMGGAIVTALAEKPAGRYQGVLAVGAALSFKINDKPLTFTHQPQIPLLFLTNQSELESPTDYIATVPKSSVRPVLWKVKRDGHVNVNQEELRSALAALTEAVEDHDRLSDRNGTRTPQPGPSPAQREGAVLRSAVREVDEVYGNLVLGVQPADFAKLGIKTGQTFQLQLGSVTATVLYGRNFSDVPKGHWVAFPTGEGWVLLSKNFESAALATKARAGSPVSLQAR